MKQVSTLTVDNGLSFVQNNIVRHALELTDAAVLNLPGGATISGHVASDSGVNGAGVYMDANSRLFVTGGLWEATGNAANQGGAMFLRDNAVAQLTSGAGVVFSQNTGGRVLLWFENECKQAGHVCVFGGRECGGWSVEVVPTW